MCAFVINLAQIDLRTVTTGIVECPLKLEPKQMAEFLEKVKAIALKYHPELLDRA